MRLSRAASLSLLLLFVQLPLLAMAAPPLLYNEGKDYKVLATDISEKVAQNRTYSDNKTEVIEFFSYACPHCNTVAQPMHDWISKNQDQVDFYRVPVSFFKGWDLLGQAYYTAVQLNVLKSVDMPIFQAIHEKNKPLKNEQDIRAFFLEHGISGEDFDKVFHSFSVKRALGDGQVLLKEYQVYGVPTVIVGNHYITSLAMAKTPERLIGIVDFLVKKSKN